MWRRIGFAILVAAAVVLFAISIAIHPRSVHAASRCGVELAYWS
jgi:hypothetical protein